MFGIRTGGVYEPNIVQRREYGAYVCMLDLTGRRASKWRRKKEKEKKISFLNNFDANEVNFSISNLKYKPTNSSNSRIIVADSESLEIYWDLDELLRLVADSDSKLAS